ncbi:VanZ family protein [Collinsella aerofaciens]|uniref:VanZ family protein n=1 Tax=Collinsella aerofaciens TaxID=74426 RepID=UPI002097E765|nr:VanZ family protein [Collinsella aerofaciens]
MKHIVGWISVVLLVVTLASIWMLTEQNVEQTSSLSESTARAVEGRAADVRPDVAQESQAGDAAEGADSTIATVHPDPLAPVRLWMGANIRRVAHTVEFFFVGLFASTTVACLGECLPCARFRYALAALFCAVCSVGDQVHKIFVPGRHFDMIDLGFDAAGYVVAMLLVLLVSAWVRHVTRPIGAHARR